MDSAVQPASSQRYGIPTAADAGQNGGNRAVTTRPRPATQIRQPTWRCAVRPYVQRVSSRVSNRETGQSLRLTCLADRASITAWEHRGCDGCGL